MPTLRSSLLPIFLYNVSHALPFSLIPTIYRLWACHFYYDDYAHPLHPLASHLPDFHGGTAEDKSRCHSREVDKWTGVLLSGAVVLECVVSVFSIKRFSHLVHTRGRKPLILYTICAGFLNTTLVLLSITLESFLLLLLAIICIGSFGPFLYNFSFQNYVLDLLPSTLSSSTSSPAPSSSIPSQVDDGAYKRAGWFAIHRGVTGAASALAAAAGGWLVDRTGKLTTPLWLAGGVQIFTFALVSLTIKETNTEECKERERIRREKEKERRKRGERKNLWRAMMSRMKKENMDSQGKVENYGVRRQVLLCSVAYFLSLLVVGFFNQMLMLFTTARLNYSEKDLGYVLFFYLGVQSTYSILIFPLLSNYGRRLFNSPDPSSTSPTVTSPLLNPPSTPSANTFDLLFTSLSFFLHSISLILLGFSHKLSLLLTGLTLSALASGAPPSILAFMSHVVEDPHRLLEAVAFMDAIGLTVSPIIMGTIYGATVQWEMGVTWFVGAGIYAIAAIILLFAKDLMKGKRKMEA